MHNRSGEHCRRCSWLQVCLPQVLKGSGLTVFASQVEQLQPLPPGQAVVQAGGAFDALYIVRSGSVKRVRSDPTGHAHVVAFYFPGEIVGLAELMQRRWMDTVITLEHTRLCRIPMSIIKGELLKQRLAHLTSARLRSQYQIHVVLARGQRPQRLAAMLLTASDHVTRGDANAVTFRLPIGNKDMASYLGLRPESVSRAYGLLQDDGWIKRQGQRITLKDVRGLRAFVGGPALHPV